MSEHKKIPCCGSCRFWHPNDSRELEPEAMCEISEVLEKRSVYCDVYESIEDDSKSTIHGPTPPQLTEGRLNDYLDDAHVEFMYHAELHHPEYLEESGQAYTQIRDIIKEHFNKPRVNREWIDIWADFWNDDFYCDKNSGHTKAHIEKMLKEIGVEVVE